MDEWKSGGKASREESQILNVKQCGHKHEGIEVMEFRALPLIAPPHLWSKSSPPPTKAATLLYHSSLFSSFFAFYFFSFIRDPIHIPSPFFLCVYVCNVTVFSFLCIRSMKKDKAREELCGLCLFWFCCFIRSYKAASAAALDRAKAKSLIPLLSVRDPLSLATCVGL